MAIASLLNEIKLMEIKLHALKVRITSEEDKAKIHTSMELYGLLKDSDDITLEDIEAVKVRIKEP